MQFKVPMIKQPKGSYYCGHACVTMLLQYYGIKASFTGVKSAIKHHPKLGVYIPQLGTYLLKRGFDVDIMTQNPFIFTVSDRGKTQRQILQRVKQAYKIVKKERRVGIKYYIEFLKHGGTITVKVPNANDIQKEVKAKRPCIAGLTSLFLAWDKPGFNFHFCLVRGIDGQYVYVNDPLKEKEYIKDKHKTDDFLYGVYASSFGDVDNGSLMRIKKRDEKW